MNKFGIVLGAAAVATLAGCKDPDFHRASAPASQNEVKSAEAIDIEPAAPKCHCAPGTKHTSPCTCGAPDCKCVVEQKPVVTADLSKPATATAPEYTVYVVQTGDYLAKISKKFNVTISSIKRLNPSIKKDVIRVGQKIKLPGKVDVGVQAAPVATAAVGSTKKSARAKKSYAPYTGATKEYVVKSGDTLGSVAYGNGINIRQLKELNGLSGDSLKVGQKLKVPAEKVEKKAAAPVAKKAEPAAPVEAKPAEAPKAEPTVAAEPKAEEKPAEAAAAPVAEAPKAETAAPAPAATTYVVQEGDDMTSVSIRWGVSAADIRELNNLAEGDQLVPGQIIKLPAEAQQ